MMPGIGVVRRGNATEMDQLHEIAPMDKKPYGTAQPCERRESVAQHRFVDVSLCEQSTIEYDKLDSEMAASLNPDDTAGYIIKPATL